ASLAARIWLDLRFAASQLLLVRSERRQESHEHPEGAPVRPSELAAVDWGDDALDAAGPDVDNRPRRVLVGDHQLRRNASRRVHQPAAGTPRRSAGWDLVWNVKRQRPS